MKYLMDRVTWASALLTAWIMMTTPPTLAQPPALDPGEPAEAALAPTSVEVINPELRTQLLTFAPYASMLNKLSLGAYKPSSIADVMEDWTSMRAQNEDPFNAHRELTAAYRDMRAFLVDSHGRITPAMRDMHLPDLQIDPLEAPELALAVLLMQASFEIGKNEAIRNWYEQYDTKCQAAYRRIMPLLRKTAKGKPTTDDSVRVRHWFAKQNDQWVYLEALNVTHKTLTNVSLCIRLETLDGAYSDHYFFIPQWRPYKGDEATPPTGVATGTRVDLSDVPGRLPIRLAGNWSKVGAKGTTLATVELVSDELMARNVKSRLDDHIPTAADQILNDVQAQLLTKSRYKKVLERLTRIRPALATQNDAVRIARLDTLSKAAGDALDAIFKSYDDRIEKAEKAIKSLREQRLRRRSDTKQIDKKISDQEAIIKKLQSERLDWAQGRR